MRRKKLGRFISKSPVLLLLLHTKSSLKVTQRTEGQKALAEAGELSGVNVSIQREDVFNFMYRL